MRGPYRSSPLALSDAKSLQDLLAKYPDQLIGELRLQSEKVTADTRRNVGQVIASDLEAALTRPTRVGERAEITRLIEKYGIEILIECANQQLSQRTISKETEVNAFEAAEKVKKYREQYEKSIESLKNCGIDTSTAPSWELITTYFLTEKIELANNMDGAELVVVPPLSPDALLRLVFMHMPKFGLKGQRIIAPMPEVLETTPENNPSQYSKWQVFIVDGRARVPLDKAIQDSRSNHEQIKALVDMYQRKGYSVLTGRRLYLALLIKGLVNKSAPDQNGPVSIFLNQETVTILNAIHVAEKADRPIEHASIHDKSLNIVRIQSSVFAKSILRIRAALQIV